METYKIQTLQKMLEQEKLNLERLKSDQNNPSYKLSEANIRKLREQLHQVGAEVSKGIFLLGKSICTSGKLGGRRRNLHKPRIPVPSKTLY